MRSAPSATRAGHRTRAPSQNKNLLNHLCRLCWCERGGVLLVGFKALVLEVDATYAGICGFISRVAKCECRSYERSRQIAIA